MPDETTQADAKLVWIVPPPEAEKAVIFVQFDENAKVTPEVQKALDTLAREMGEGSPGGAMCSIVGTCGSFAGCEPVSGGVCRAYFSCNISW